MKAVTIIFAACAFLLSMLMPVTSNPLPEIRMEGRDFNSRFAPPARPVFPRSYYENVTTSAAPPGPTAVKRDYPAGPTASALVFRSEHQDLAPRL